MNLMFFLPGNMVSGTATTSNFGLRNHFQINGFFLVHGGLLLKTIVSTQCVKCD